LLSSRFPPDDNTIHAKHVIAVGEQSKGFVRLGDIFEADCAIESFVFRNRFLQTSFVFGKSFVEKHTRESKPAATLEKVAAVRDLSKNSRLLDVEVRTSLSILASSRSVEEETGRWINLRALLHETHCAAETHRGLVRSVYVKRNIVSNIKQ
jgi:hypothetical protein